LINSAWGQALRGGLTLAQRKSKGVVTSKDLRDETNEERLEREEQERKEAEERNKEVQSEEDPVLAHRRRHLYGTLDSNESRESK